METFECLMLWVFIIGALVWWYIDGVKKYDKQKYARWQFRQLPKEEQQSRIEASNARRQLWDELGRLRHDAAIERQYREHYSPKDPDAPWIAEDVRQYAKEEMRRDPCIGTPGGQFGCLWYYAWCFAKERMIRDRKALPDKFVWPSRFYDVADPEALLVKQCWVLWEISNYPKVVKHYAETGEFLLPYQWKPLKEIPDWNDGRNSMLQ